MAEKQTGRRECRDNLNMQLVGVIVDDVAVDILDNALKNKLVEVAVELVDVKLGDAEADR